MPKNKNDIRMLAPKGNAMQRYRKNNKEMNVFLTILKDMLHPNMFDMIHPTGKKNLSIFNNEYQLNIKHHEHRYIIFSDKMDDIVCSSLNEAVVEFCKKIIHIRGDCNGFNFNVVDLDESLIPTLKEKWYYNTMCMIPMKDYLYDCVNHIAIHNWKYYLDLTKVNSIKLIEFLLMRKLVERSPNAVKNC